MVRFESNRCFVREFIESDIDLFMDYRNNDEWMKYQGFKGLSKKEYKEALLGKGSLEEGMQFAVIEKITNELIGDIYLKKSEEGIWYGYTISPQHARKGYIHEISLSLIQWVKSKGNHQIFAGVLPENIASSELLKKIGFKYINTDEYGEAIYSLKI